MRGAVLCNALCTSNTPHRNKKHFLTETATNVVRVVARCETTDGGKWVGLVSDLALRSHSRRIAHRLVGPIGRGGGCATEEWTECIAIHRTLSGPGSADLCLAAVHVGSAGSSGRVVRRSAYMCAWRGGRGSPLGALRSCSPQPPHHSLVGTSHLHRMWAVGNGLLRISVRAYGTGHEGGRRRGDAGVHERV
jgi:hypothetical protein